LILQNYKTGASVWKLTTRQPEKKSEVQSCVLIVGHGNRLNRRPALIRRILILGASYGSLFATKLLMAVHDVTLVCRRATADLINMSGTEVCLPLRDETTPRRIRSTELSGRLDAKPPEVVDPSDYDLIVLAMQEPQYLHTAVRALIKRIGDARVPCLSLMNMPPLPYLKRIPGIDPMAAEAAYSDPRIWA